MLTAQAASTDHATSSSYLKTEQLVVLSNGLAILKQSELLYYFYYYLASSRAIAQSSQAANANRATTTHGLITKLLVVVQAVMAWPF
jgi:hypothetical protein